MAEFCGRAPRSPVVRGIVERLWFVADATSAGDEIKLPTTTAQLLVNLDGDRLTTRTLSPRSLAPRSLRRQRDSAGEVTGPVGLSAIAPSAVVLDRAEQRRIVGVVLRPEAVGPVARVPGVDLGLLTGLDDLWGSSAYTLAEAGRRARTGAQALDLVEEGLVAALGGLEVDRTTRVVVGLLRAGARVGEVGERIGLSQSTWTRRFRAATGMTPKRYQRLLRLERAVLRATAPRPDGAGPDWAAVAAEAGCYDQAHLVHEFTELAGVTPTRWYSMATPNPFHLRAADDDFLQDGSARPR